jgi:hypothetical protein
VKCWGIRAGFREILRRAISACPENRCDRFRLSLTVSHNHLACSCESGSIILICAFWSVIRITGRRIEGPG